MKQIFNPAIDVDKYGNEISGFLPPGAQAEKPKIKRRRGRRPNADKPEAKRTVEGFEIRSGVPVPDIRKKRDICKWDRLHKAMNIGDCVPMDKKQANAFQVWAKNHDKKVVTRTVGGETLVFKMRKDRSKKEK